MLIKPDCIPCILNMAVSAVERTHLQEGEAKVLMAEIMDNNGMRGLSWGHTSPELIEWVWEKIIAATGNPDPLFEEKQTLNHTIADLEPSFRKLIKESSDPLYTAIKLSIIGNSIDIMMPGGLSNVAKFFQEKLDTPISMEAFSSFKDRLRKSQNIAYCGDNAGEIITDKMLIETILDNYSTNIIFITRSVPTLNDVTLDEAHSVGMDKIVSVIANGISGPFPGTTLTKCSKHVKDILEKADLIISKGGGNFDSLDEEKDLKNISFLLLTKCSPYKQLFNTRMHDPVLINRF